MGKKPWVLPATIVIGCCAGVGVMREACASAFAIQEQSASDLGRSFAGTASTPDDPSILYYNPAGITAFKQFTSSAGLTLIDVSSSFTNTNSIPAYGQALGGNGGNAGSWNTVPNLYLVGPVSDSVSLGLAINAPFGLKLDYAGNWLGQYQGIYSELKTMNFNPAVAWQVNNHLSIGAGVDYEKINSTLTSGVDYSAAIAGGVQQLAQAGQIPAAAVPSLLAANAGLSGSTRVSGTGAGWGFNLGALYTVNDVLRFGLAYRSEVHATIRGSVGFSAPTVANQVGQEIVAGASAAGGALSNGSVYLPLTLPSSVTGSADVLVDPRLRVVADLQYTQWSVFKNLNVTRNSGPLLSATPELYHNTWRVALGAEYTLSSQWMLRAGTAYDQTPVPASTRNPRLPDNSRVWISTGLQWKPAPRFTIDLGYAHLFEQATPLDINGGNAALYGDIVGNQSSHVDIIAVQAATAF